MSSYITDNDNEFRCSSCNGPLTNDAKLIADCYETICSDCYQDLMSRVDEAGKYECPLCKKTHEMPSKGLPDNTFLARFIKRPRIERPLESSEIALKENIMTLEMQLQELESFDHKDHMDLYYKQIEREIIEAVDDAIDGINVMRAEAIEKVKKNKERSLKTLERRISLDQANLKTLTERISKFSAKWRDAWDGSNSTLSVEEEAVQEALDTSKDLKSSIESLKTEMGETALDNMRVILKCGRLRRIYRHKLVKIVSQSTPSDIEPSVEDVVRGFELAGHTSWLGQVLFLQNGLLASCSHDRTIKIWNIAKRCLHFELLGHTSDIKSLQELPMTRLASCAKNEIRIWDLRIRQTVDTISLSEPCSISALSNGFLASYSKYGSLTISDPSECTLFLYKRGQHGSPLFNFKPYIDCLSNGNLVTCLRDEQCRAVCEFKVRDARSGKVLMTVCTGAKNVSSQLLLSDDKLALGTKTGSIAIIDFASGSFLKKNFQAHESHVSALAELSLGRLLSCGVHNNTAWISIWRLSDFSLISAHNTGIETYIESISISRDEKYAALSKRSDFKITIWPLD